jgi:hypothetical protein
MLLLRCAELLGALLMMATLAVLSRCPVAGSRNAQPNPSNYFMNSTQM